MKKFLLTVGVLFCLPLVNDADTLVIHEWGTFTSLQDENGNTIGGINTDDEPVPSFVHSLGTIPILRDSPVPIFGNCYTKCAQLPAAHPSVTMRLETPVVYVYPPSNETQPLSIDVEVEFLHGWITQFYPGGEGDLGQPELSAESKGRLVWKNLLVGGNWSGPKTDDAVWLAPREVKASSVQAANGEAEKYLFYRGIGNLDAPLRVKFNEEQDEYHVTPHQVDILADLQNQDISKLWLTDIRSDSSVAFRAVPAVSFANNTGVLTRASFVESDYHKDNLANLWAEMEEALIQDGLYPDEAQSMLRTWQVSYFKNPGTRLFFLVPEAWTNHILPIRFSASGQKDLPQQIERVMVGRIELLGQRQRQILKNLSDGPVPDLSKVIADVFRLAQDEKTNAQFQQVLHGRLSLVTLGIEVPAFYQEYLNLGRFRDALLLHQLSKQPTPALKQFAQSIGLGR